MSDERRPNDCCNDRANFDEVVQLADDLCFEKCKECGCRHFELTVDPMTIGWEPMPVGG